MATKAEALAPSVAQKYVYFATKQQTEACRTQCESSDDGTESQPPDGKVLETLKAFRRFLVGAAAFETSWAQMQSFAALNSQELVPNNLNGQAVLERKGHGPLQQTNDRKTLRARTWQVCRSHLAQAIDTLLVHGDLMLAGKLFTEFVFDALQ